MDGSIAQNLNILSTGITFNNITLDNSFGASPQVTVNGGNLTVSSVLRMDGGNVNLNENTLTLTSTGDGALDHNLTSGDGWMYGGSFARARPAGTAINVGIAHSFFPLGSASDWRPFFAGQNNGTTAGTMTVSHTNSKYQQ